MGTVFRTQRVQARVKNRGEKVNIVREASNLHMMQPDTIIMPIKRMAMILILMVPTLQTVTSEYQLNDLKTLTSFIPFFLSETTSMAKEGGRADAPFVALRLRLWLLRFVKIPHV